MIVATLCDVILTMRRVLILMRVKGRFKIYCSYAFVILMFTHFIVIKLGEYTFDVFDQMNDC